MSEYSRVRASGLSKRTPCQPSLTCGPETPSPSRNRPPDRVSRVAAVIAQFAGVRPGIWKMAEPMSIVGHWAATQASTVAASEPYASATHATAKPRVSACLASARLSESFPPPQYPRLSPSCTVIPFPGRTGSPFWVRR